MFYVDLFAALTRHKVDYLLTGRLAVALHGVERATMDVDITVAMKPDKIKGASVIKCPTLHSTLKTSVMASNYSPS